MYRRRTRVRRRAVRVPHDVHNIVQNVQRVHCELVSSGLEQRGENRFEEPTNRLHAFKRPIGTDEDGLVGVIAEDALRSPAARAPRWCSKTCRVVSISVAIAPREHTIRNASTAILCALREPE